jgi:hypothetical protein
VILPNGRHPIQFGPSPRAGIVCAGTGTRTCFADNIFATEFPAGITTLSPCGG